MSAQNHYFGTIGQKSCRQCSCSPTEEIKLFSNVLALLCDAEEYLNKS